MLTEILIGRKFPIVYFVPAVREAKLETAELAVLVVMAAPTFTEITYYTLSTDLTNISAFKTIIFKHDSMIEVAQ